jgi:predicted ArsR family transcriptional regulator
MIQDFDYNILQKLKEYINGVDRDSFAKSLKVPRTTLYNHLEKLEKKGCVERHQEITGTRGRPPVIWEFKKFLN